jgi:hypothetical protein
MSTTEPPLRIELRRPYGQLALASLLFAGCAAFLWHRAATNDRGLIINGLIELGPGSADIFYAVLTALSLGFVILGALSLLGIKQLRHYRLVVDDESISLPPARAFAAKGEQVVPLDEVHAVETYPAEAPRALVVVAESGRYGLDKRVLPDGVTIPELAQAIAARVRARADRDAQAEKKRKRP